MKLNTTNPNQFLYESGTMTMYLLGGVQLRGLDRMRVTLKIEVEQKSIRHNIDLYNDLQVERFVRRIADKLEIHTQTIEKEIDNLINEIESYRVGVLKNSENENFGTQKEELTKVEIAEAEHYLKEKNLIQRTNDDIGKSGVVGEELNRILLYLIYTSRKMTKPLQAVNLGASGTGKTHLQSKVGGLIPPEDTLSLTFLSENSFYYFGKEELKHKLILIEDLDGVETALYPLRELQSKGKITKTIVAKKSNGETRTSQLVVEGPVCVSGCTTRENIYEDNANRSFLIQLDESKEQDEKIMSYQRKQASGTVNDKEEADIQKLLQNCQRTLKPLKVRNPFAEELIIPAQTLKPRRTNAHYLAFIEAVTFYNQYQRKQKTDKETKEKYVETTIDDLKEANNLMKDVLLRKSDELSGGCRNYLEQIKAYLKKENKSSFKNAEIRNAIRINLNNQKYYTQILLNYNFLEKSGRKETGYVYQLVNPEEYKTLKNQIENTLDQIITQIIHSKSR